ncbi:MAG: DUF354 domain-containing protein, partial [bacterium]|nr:DUF354 domain-containing protein [bacterium]
LGKTHDLRLCTLRRGRQVEVIRHDCPDLPLTVLGDYGKNKGAFSFIFRVILPRLYGLWKFIKKEKFQLVITANYQANIVARFLGIPSIGFNDDPEKINLKVLKIFANEVYIPLFGSPRGKVKVFNALKEWSYLSPRYFAPRGEVLAAYGLKPKEYLFVREVSTKSLNYREQQSGSVLSFARQLPSEYPVVLSLEDKTMKDEYPAQWTLLEEPVEDIHSLMYYSSAVISSGDSMAREGAMLGVPAIYCGVRDMAANRVLMDEELLFKVLPVDVPGFVQGILSGHMQDMQNKPLQQELFRSQLSDRWDDVTTFILSVVQRYEDEEKENNT